MKPFILPEMTFKCRSRSSAMVQFNKPPVTLIVYSNLAPRRFWAARIVSNTRKFDRGLTHFRRSQLQWLGVVDRVRIRVCVQVFRCLHKMALEYLSTYCQPVSGISGRRHLRSADRGHLDFPRETCFVRRTFICIRRPFELELT